jgi:hypothetical protein
VVGNVRYAPANTRHYSTVRTLGTVTSNTGIEPIFVSVKEAAQALGVSTWALYELLDDEARPIDSRYKGRRRLVSVKSLREYAESLPVERPEAS